MIFLLNNLLDDTLNHLIKTPDFNNNRLLLQIQKRKNYNSSVRTGTKKIRYHEFDELTETAVIFQNCAHYILIVMYKQLKIDFLTNL